MKGCGGTICAVKSQPWISVTEAGHESITLRELARKAIPILSNPDRFTAIQRQEVAHRLASVLGTSCDSEMTVVSTS